MVGAAAEHRHRLGRGHPRLLGARSAAERARPVGGIQAPVVPAARGALAAWGTAILAEKTGAVVVDLGPILMTTGSLESAAAIFVRALALAVPLVVLASTIDPRDLSDALVQHLRLPETVVVSVLAASRLLGLLVTEWQTLAMARRARGWPEVPCAAHRRPLRRDLRPPRPVDQAGDEAGDGDGGSRLRATGTHVAATLTIRDRRRGRRAHRDGRHRGGDRLGAPAGDMEPDHPRLRRAHT
ncbi:hypothetical protein IOD13_02380 [Brevibacterium casei]|nr:hypothetical protein [Brevibacterium casei]